MNVVELAEDHAKRLADGDTSVGDASLHADAVVATVSKFAVSHETHNASMSVISTQLEVIAAALPRIDARIDRLDDRLDGRLNQVTSDLGALRGELGAFRTETAGAFGAVRTDTADALGAVRTKIAEATGSVTKTVLVTLVGVVVAIGPVTVATAYALKLLGLN